MSDGRESLKDERAASTLSLAYKVISDGDEVGEIKTLRLAQLQSGKMLLRVHNTLAIRSTGLWSDYSLLSKEDLLFSEKGLFEFTAESKENDSSSTATGKLDNGVFRINVCEDAEERVHVFPSSGFDATSEDASARFILLKKRQAELRILDLDTFEIDEIKYGYLRREQIVLADISFNTSVVSFATKNSHGLQWLVEVDTGHVMLREVSKEQGEQNEITLVDMGKEWSEQWPQTMRGLE